MSEPATIDTCEGLIPVAIQGLCPSDGYDFDLYLWPDDSPAPRLFRSRAYPFTRDDLDKLVDRGEHILYVRSCHADSYRDHLTKNVLNNNALPLSLRFGMLRESARSVLNNAFRSGEPGLLVSTSREVGGQMSDLVCTSEATMFDLVGLMQNDYSAFTHAVNVCSYSVALARLLGILDTRELSALAQGALLHDIGKHLSSPGDEGAAGRGPRDRRTADTQHPITGFKHFSQREDVNWNQLMMIYHHHERWDGRGFPMGLTGTEIHEWSRICAVANDVARYLRDLRQGRPFLKCGVLEFLESQAGKALDEEMALCWIMSAKSSVP